MQKSKTKHLARLALFTAAALALHYAETFFLPFIIIPGIKLGLANIVTLLVLVLFGSRDAGMVLLARLILAAAFSPSFSSLIYAGFGGICAFVAMRVLFVNFRFSIIPTSIVGALIHNLAQLTAAAFILNSNVVFWYFPLLAVSGIIAGMVTGWLAKCIVKKWTIA